MKEMWEEIVKMIIENHPTTREEVEKIKRMVAGKWSLPEPRNSDILRYLPEEYREEFVPLLRKKPTRTLSGVAVVAAMTSPAPCPHGTCLYCPGGVKGWTPQSYTGKEPAALRASQNNYDPYLQVRVRLRQLKEIGHSTEKIDFIVMGGTLTARSLRYQRWFVKRALDAFNDKIAINLEEAKKLNETAKHRAIGITFETRPDWITEENLFQMLRMGTTRVEIGVQSLSDEVLKMVKRGHGVKESIEATRLLKDSGLKVCYHMMPGLPGQRRGDIVKELREIFTDSRFMPDMLKIYPTLVVKGAKLYEIWKKGLYTPLREGEVVGILAEAKRYFPPWVRVQRVQRDIPSYLIEEGVKASNLRELVHEKMRKGGTRCRCVRCREVGLSTRKGDWPEEDPVMINRSYNASGGEEVFISFEYPKEDLILGYLRLRLPTWAPGYNPLKDTVGDHALIREVKVFGRAVPIGNEGKGSWQHKGYGEKLVKEAERIAEEEWGVRNIYITSGVGVREYYRTLGYRVKEPYMYRRLN